MTEHDENLSQNRSSLFPGTRKSVLLSWRRRARSLLRIARSGGNNLKSHSYWLDNFLSWARLRTVLPASRTGPRSWRWSLRSWRRPDFSTILMMMMLTWWHLQGKWLKTNFLSKPQVQCFQCEEYVYSWKEKHHSAWVTHARFSFSLCEERRFMFFLMRECCLKDERWNVKLLVHANYSRAFCQIFNWVVKWQLAILSFESNINFSVERESCEIKDYLPNYWNTIVLLRESPECPFVVKEKGKQFVEESKALPINPRVKIVNLWICG